MKELSQKAHCARVQYEREINPEILQIWLDLEKAIAAKSLASQLIFYPQKSLKEKYPKILDSYITKRKLQMESDKAPFKSISTMILEIKKLTSAQVFELSKKIN